MRMYIAGRTSQRAEVKELNERFKKLGFEIADWTEHLSTKPFEKHREIAKKYSIEDLGHVKNCDIFILLTKDIPGLGSTTEFGMALMLNSINNKPSIYVVGSDINNMFFMHPEVKIRKTIDEVVNEIKS